MSRGVLLIALGHPMYGQLAANLAMSIKFKCPNLPIHLVWADHALTHLTEEKLKFFDTMEECPHEMYHRSEEGGDKKAYIKAKVYMYNLSPFKETIFLDVDTIMCPTHTLNDAFDRLKDLDFTMENRSRVDLSKVAQHDTYLWASIKDIQDIYGFNDGYLYQLHSEFVYFKRNKKVGEFFKEAQKIFDDPKIPMKHVFNGDIPDEVCFAIAMIKKNFYPHACPYVPLYWFLSDRGKGSSIKYVHDNYYGYSIGGNRTPDHVLRIYNQMARAYASRMNVQHPYRPLRKNQVMAERKHM